MLRVIAKALRWDSYDVLRMASIIGADSADNGRAPVNAAIIKAAKKKGVRLHPSVRSYLDGQIAERRIAEQLKKIEDYQEGLKKAFPHQRADLYYMMQMGLPAYLLAHKTGVGKTLSALMFAKYVAQTPRNLIITKNLAKEQWEDAIYNFIGKREPVTVIDGNLDKQHESIVSTFDGWVIAHWEALQNQPLSFLAHKWGTIIADEAHLASNRRTMRHEVLKRIRSQYRIAATAHPFTKDPGEMFAILRFLYPKVYRSYWQFFFMHVRATPKPFGGFEIEGAKRPKLLRWEIAPFTLMRTKQEVFKNLPRIAPVRVPVKLSARGSREYDKLKRQMFVELDALEGGTKVLPIINSLSRVTRCRQYLIDPALVGAREKSVKYEQTLELLDMIAAPTVIFTEWKKSALGLGAYLQKKDKSLSVDYIHGGMQKRISRVKERFLGGVTDALIVVAAAGDTALNLGGYGYLIHLDLPFTPRAYEQRQGRVDRPREHTGELVPTTEYRIVTKDSYEEKLEQRLIKRHSTFTGVFTVKDLRGLFE